GWLQGGHRRRIPFRMAVDLAASILRGASKRKRQIGGSVLHILPHGIRKEAARANRLGFPAPDRLAFGTTAIKSKMSS
ncbi:hypothetical protein, partial [Bradyrhizobium sp.]|uniref:hypothetical protein n=1 Tax=Bradyrhizobium sp. TaxID=376 RepID=UPI003C73C21C